MFFLTCMFHLSRMCLGSRDTYLLLGLAVVLLVPLFIIFSKNFLIVSLVKSLSIYFDIERSPKQSVPNGNWFITPSPTSLAGSAP